MNGWEQPAIGTKTFLSSCYNEAYVNSLLQLVEYKTRREKVNQIFVQSKKLCTRE